VKTFARLAVDFVLDGEVVENDYSRCAWRQIAARRNHAYAASAFEFGDHPPRKVIDSFLRLAHAIAKRREGNIKDERDIVVSCGLWVVSQEWEVKGLNGFRRRPDTEAENIAPDPHPCP
jgi:hypothetical protein